MNNTKGDVSDAAVLPEQLCKLRQACKMFVFHFIPCPSCLSFSSFLFFHLLKKKKAGIITDGQKTIFWLLYKNDFLRHSAS